MTKLNYWDELLNLETPGYYLTDRSAARIHAEIDFQHQPPQGKESNWLPAPNAPFYMLMRMYLPSMEILNGQYEIPAVRQSK
jgi:hypothetical protein